MARKRKHVSKGKKGHRREVLQGHTRKGKRFIPPLVQMLNIRELRWADLIPELVWIALLLDLYGLREGSALALSFARAANDTKRNQPKKLFARAQAFSILTDQERQTVVTELEAGGTRTRLQAALEPITRMYPDYPIGFLGSPSPNDVRLDGMERLRRSLQQLRDRSSVLAMRTQACVLYIGFVTGVFKVAS